MKHVPGARDVERRVTPSANPTYGATELFCRPYPLGSSTPFAVAEVVRPILADSYTFAPMTLGSTCRARRRHRRSLSACAAPPVVPIPVMRSEILCTAMPAGRFRRVLRAGGLVSSGLPRAAGGCPARRCRRTARSIHMPCGKEFGHSRRFLSLHAPRAVFARRLDAQQARTLAMSLQLPSDLVRDEVGLGDEHSEWLVRLLPIIEPLNSPLVGHRNHQLNRHAVSRLRRRRAGGGSSVGSWAPRVLRSSSPILDCEIRDAAECVEVVRDERCAYVAERAGSRLISGGVTSESTTFIRSSSGRYGCRSDFIGRRPARRRRAVVGRGSGS